MRTHSETTASFAQRGSASDFSDSFRVATSVRRGPEACLLPASRFLLPASCFLLLLLLLLGPMSKRDDYVNIIICTTAVRFFLLVNNIDGFDTGIRLPPPPLFLPLPLPRARAASHRESGSAPSLALRAETPAPRGGAADSRRENPRGPRVPSREMRGPPSVRGTFTPLE